MNHRNKLASCFLVIAGLTTGCDETGRYGNDLPDGSGDVQINVPTSTDTITPSPTTPARVDVNVDGANSGTGLAPNVSTSDAVDARAERREMRRERLGEALDNVDLNVDTPNADIDVD